tara:strand:- start:1891 stop:2646 length:756 start_codon:yes stop_codon:yes gene_type:complete
LTHGPISLKIERPGELLIIQKNSTKVAMLGHFLKKSSHYINLIQFRIGELLFPFLEPFLRILENRNPEVRKHFRHALKSLENKSFNVALINLNMVLSLFPSHFLARVYRARLCVCEKRYRLAIEDYLVASQTSRFRFIHYDLYWEYFSAINGGEDSINSPIMKNFDQAYEMMRLDKDRMAIFSEQEKLAYLYQDDEESIENYEDALFMDDLVFSEEERSGFSKLGPITIKEIEKTDWEVLCKELSSKTKAP